MSQKFQMSDHRRQNFTVVGLNRHKTAPKTFHHVPALSKPGADLKALLPAVVYAYHAVCLSFRVPLLLMIGGFLGARLTIRVALGLEHGSLPQLL